MRKIHGFTLAEILITLGIIGIVAAMTIPSLITNYRRKQLEIRFKQADSLVTQAMKSTLYELEYDKQSDMDLDASSSVIEERRREYNDIWEKQFKGVTKLQACKIINKPVKNFYLENDGYRNYCWSFGGNDSYALLLSNGSLVSEIQVSKETVYLNRAVFFVSIDTNGPYNGPNAYGYDIFFITPEDFERVTAGLLCDPFRTSTANLHGCYWYAHKNTSAFKGLNYWDTLYRSKEYLQKLKDEA